MPIHLECLSHTPLHGYHDPEPAIVAEVRAHHEAARARVAAFDPELVVVFTPDHYNGFFYDLMPPFCIGAAASAVGDYGSLAGPLDVPDDVAVNMAHAVLAAEVDVALSYRMQVDHGCAQPLALLTGSLDRYPTVPVFINSVAPPLAACRRARLLGEAIGRYLAGLDRRVLVIGSGGISHEPPVPELAGARGEMAERLIAGRNPDAQARAARQERTVAAARAFAGGGSPLRALNPEWDRAFLQQLADQRLDAFDAWTDAQITRDGGKSAHEIRTWIAAFAALAAAGRYRATIDYYRPIPEWIAGFALMHGQTAPGHA